MGSATITINTDALSTDFVEGLKRMYPHQTIEISIRPSDATDEILNNPAYAAELSRRIAALKAGELPVIVAPEDLS